MRTFILMVATLATVILTFSACKKKEGCTNSVAVNYDSNATSDDGSCQYDSTNYAQLNVTLPSCTTTGQPGSSTFGTVDALRNATIAFLNSLDQTIVDDLSYCLDDTELYSWTNTPGNRTGGIQFGLLDPGQQELLFNMFNAFLSDDGYTKVDYIARTIEEYLGTIDGSVWGLQYFTMALFGNPETDGSWALQLDGHHCAMTFLVHGDQVIMAPVFLGCEPAEYNGVMILEDELNLGNAFYNSLDATQQGSAYIAGLVGPDVVVGAGNNSDQDDNKDFDYSVFNNVGLSLSGLTTTQQTSAMTLIEEYIGNLDGSFTGDLLTTIQTNLSTGFFVYSTDDFRVYYRIYIPDLLLIEYDDPNPIGTSSNGTSTVHQHTITRLLDNSLFDDYGVFARQAGPATIGEHYRNSKHHFGGEKQDHSHNHYHTHGDHTHHH